MKKDEITPKSRQSVPEVISPPNVHQFVAKNAYELWRFQSRKDLFGDQDPGPPPSGSGGGEKAIDQPQLTPGSPNRDADRIEQ
jgi:hypothetical protein